MLVSAANDAGGRDNVTAVVVDIHSDDDGADDDDPAPRGSLVADAVWGRTIARWPLADVSYVPARADRGAGDQCWALVETSPDSPAVTRIWRQLGQGVAADALLAGLLADGIGGTPGFALLRQAGGSSRRCRGTVGATVVTAGPR